MRTRLLMAARRALAILLSLLMVVSPPLQSVALAEGTEGGPYLAEVYVGVDKTAKKAAEALEADGWTVLKREGEPADLNEGANAALKSNRAVVLGYKTTDDSTQAITDLAVMNMNGGYSFSDYRELMDKYRDSQIRPFIERFMATVNEYRANAASDDPGNRARADMARTFLNRIVDDDTGGFLGDLLLEQTKAELGDAYESLSKDEKKQHIDLETALMQGDASMVLQVERLLSLAADSADTTWLERLSALGPDGLAASMGYARPADAEAELASRYQDLATQLADGWEDMRARLLAQDAGDEEQSDEAEAEDDQPASDVQADGEAGEDAIVLEDGDEAIMVEDDPVTEGEDPLILVGETEAPVASAPASTAEVVELEGDDEVDIAELVSLEPPEDMEELGADEASLEDMLNISDDDILGAYADVSEAIGVMAEGGADVSDTREAAIATYLRTLPYGDGTLYDLFTTPSSDVSGSNISALYPAASCLSDGQAAAIEFLSLADLLQIGCTTGDALAEVWTDATGLKENAEIAPVVSLYEGVDREIFSKLTALTSEAMRADALRAQDTGVVDFLSTYRRSALLWTGTAMTALVAIASSAIASRSAAGLAAQATKDALARAEYYKQQLAGWIEQFVDNGQNLNRKIVGVEFIFVEEKINTAGQPVKEVTLIPRAERDYWEISNARYKWKEIDKYQYEDELEELYKWRRTNAASKTFDIDAPIKQLDGENTILQLDLEYKDNLDDYIETVEAPVQNPTSKWSYVSRVGSIAFFVLTLISIISTAIDVYNYYNVDYAPIPGYMVDVSDITQVADDGTTTVVRNDKAYYRVAFTNARREDEDLVAMKDYADLNGDAGKEWVALYKASRDGQAPILADSLRVVMGTNSIPDGYSTGIHEFGSDAAANLTDARYCYNDDAGGVYAYFRRDEGAASVAGSAFGGGSAALWAGAGLVVGAAAGAGVTTAVGRRRRESASA